MGRYATAVKDKTRSANYLKKKALLFIQIPQFGLKISTMHITSLYLIDIFWHRAYKDYPVVGVTWDQARLFVIIKRKQKETT